MMHTNLQFAFAVLDLNCHLLNFDFHQQTPFQAARTRNYRRKKSFVIFGIQPGRGFLGTRLAPVLV
jgi:hypothetical protein